MAIIEQLVEQSARKLENLKMNNHKKAREKVEVIASKDVSMGLEQQIHPSPTSDPLNSSGSVISSEGADVASSYSSRDESQEVTSVVTPDGFLYPLSAIYSGSSSPFTNMHVYMPYSIDGVQYYSPVIDYSLLNQPFYGSFSCDLQYPAQGYLYGNQLYQYSPQAYYQQVASGHYFSAPLGLPAGGMMMLDPQDPAQLGVVMSSEFTNVSGHAVPSPGLPLTIVPPSLPGKGAASVTSAHSSSHTLRASAPAWVESTSFKHKSLQNNGNSGGIQLGVTQSSVSLRNNKSASSATPAVLGAAPYKCPPAAAITVSASHYMKGASNSTASPSASIGKANSCLEGDIKQEGNISSSVNNPSVPLDTWVSKVRGQPAPAITTPKDSSGTPNKDLGLCLPNGEEYNSSNFVIKYAQAKYFIIKSYTEDNVYRSIENSVWASTPNGNKKLDEAYQDAQCRATGKSSRCPVFLFFSVNGSRQFCGVAEMTGPLDYTRTMAFWEQHKWSGSFPVKWHIIKNVPNSHFRKIILENNESKPVTNSRDTQEVNLQQGLEMLSIFKNYPGRTSILDDFPVFATQKEMQDVQLQRWPPHCFPKIGEHLKDQDEAGGSRTTTLNLPASKFYDDRQKPKEAICQEKKDAKVEAKES